MANRPSTLVRNAMVDAFTARVDAGSGPGVVKIYTGGQPATGDGAATGTLLATVVLADPAFGAASGGVASATDPGQVTPTADGTAGWYRVTDSAGTALLDGLVTATGGGGEMQLSNIALTTGSPVDINVFTVTQPAG